jgi:hypothetical protein
MTTLTGAADTLRFALAVQFGRQNVTYALAHWAGSKTFEACHGVDLTNLTVHAGSGAIKLDDISDLDEYLYSAVGATLWPMPFRTRDFTAAVVRQASISLPYQSISKSWLNVSEVYQQLSLVVSLDDKWMWEVKWVFVSATFTPRWSNPAWHVLGVDFGTEEEQIRKKLENVASQQLHRLHPNIIEQIFWKP